MEKRLRIKPHTLPADHIEKGNKASDAPVDEPSWFKKFQIQLKKTFCLSLDLQERMYDAHVPEKKARLRQKQIMGAMQLPVSDGSEGNITPKEQWISEHSTWFDGEASGQPEGQQGAAGAE